MNTLFHLPYAYPVSLGYNCHVKVLVERFGEMERKGYPRLPFDWLGTPMYSICELLENNFEDFTNNSYFILNQRKKHLQTEYLTNTKYDFCFVHDYGKDLKNISPEQFEKTAEDYTRRIQRWKDDVLQSGKHILFFRLEQLEEERTEYLRKESEEFYVKRFCNLMKEKGVQFHVVWFSQTAEERSYDKEYRIITVPFRMKDIKITISADHLLPVLKGSLSFVNDCLRK